MFKLMILLGPICETDSFIEGWPTFLHQAEAMPGLIREATVRVQAHLWGEDTLSMIHELFFETRKALDLAMASPAGQAAGETLQRLTAGRMTLLIAEHREDDLANIQRYRVPSTTA